MFKSLKTRKERLRHKILEELLKDNPNVDKIIYIIEEYESDNINTIEKLKRDKRIELNRINGALKQTINAHGAITKELIGSAAKRIYGSLLDYSNCVKFRTISIRDILIGFLIGVIFFWFFLQN